MGNTPTPNFNDLAPLLKEIDSMRGTLTKFVTVIKQQDERLKVLEAKLEQVDIPSYKERLIRRFDESSKHNRSVNEPPAKLALVLHLTRVKQLPDVLIYHSGLLSKNKMHGISRWTAQHATDFCELSGVLDIYHNGVDDLTMMELIPDYKLIKRYLAGQDTPQSD